MSDVAASGGYMLSLSADQIFADEFTITGSIGVISGKFNISKLLNYLGIGHQNISVGKNASIYSPLKKLSKEESVLLNELVENMYHDFVNLVSENRNIEFGETEKISQGRVWIGTQAHKNRLIDKIGNIEDAIEYIISQIGEANRDKIIFKNISKKVDLLSSNLSKTLSSQLSEYYNVVEMINRERILALMPFFLKIK